MLTTMSIRKAVKDRPAYNFEPKPYTIKLDQNESPYDLSAELKEKVFDKLRDTAFNRYPDIHADGLRADIADYCDWPELGIAVGSGSNTLIRRMIEISGLGQTVLCLKPTFAVYELDANLLEPDALIELDLNADFSLPVEKLKEVLASKTGVFFLANPAAPTGNIHPQTEVLELLKVAQQNDWTVIIDEAYHQFSDTDYSKLIKDFPNMICLRTLSKAFGLAGVRLGYALGNPDYIKHVQKAIPPFSVSVVQLAIAEVVLGDGRQVVEDYIQEVRSERERIFAALDAANIAYHPSATNFFLLPCKDPEKLYNAVLADGLLIRRQDHLVESCLRISIGKPEENTEMLKIILKHY